MSGDGDLTVVWVAQGPSTAREDAAHALAEWARARGVVLQAATEGTSARGIRIDVTVGDRVEKEIDRAREAIAALDADTAERALARAETALREHPELPHAAWLRAEVLRVWASRFSRVEPRDEARSRAAWEEAEALDGGRVAGVGEAKFPPRRRVGVTIVLRGAAAPPVVTRVDGVEVAGSPSPAEGTVTYALDIPSAEHHVVVTRDDEEVFAGWVAVPDVPPTAPRLTVPIDVGDGGACAGGSFAGVVRDARGTVRAQGVSCDRWVAAIPGPQRGSVLVARCERDACGPLLEWRTDNGFTRGDVGPSHGRAWPAWATWTAIGVGVAGAIVTTIIATGALESRPVEPRFVAGGVRVE